MKIKVGVLRRIIKEEAEQLRRRIISEGMGAGFPRSDEELADRLRPAFKRVDVSMPDFTKIHRLWMSMEDTRRDGGGWTDFVESDVLDWLQTHTDVAVDDIDVIMQALQT